MGQKVTLNTLILCQELHRGFSSIAGARQCCDQPCSSPGWGHLALGAVTTWFAAATEGRASSAGVSSASSLGLWEQIPFVAFWEEPQNPAHSGYCKTTPETLIVMGSHQGKKRLTRRGLWWALMEVLVRAFFFFFWIEEVLLVRSLMRFEVPPYRAGRIFLAWMQTEREALGQQGRRVFKMFFCEPSLSEGLFSGETWLGKPPVL